MRDLLQLLLAALAVLAVGAVAWRLLFGGEEEGTLLRVAGVAGEVSIVGPRGRVPADPGKRVGLHDRLAVGPGGRLDLELGAEGRLVLGGTTRASVAGADERGVVLDLEEGRVEATVRPGDGGLAVVAGGRVVRGSDARFEVVRREDAVAARTLEGTVELQGFGEAAFLPAGQQVVAAGDDVRLREAAEDLLLDVVPPLAARTRETTVVLAGSTEPRARVRVRLPTGEVRALLADASGRFRLVIPLVEGANEVRVEAEGILGGQREVRWSIVRDTTGPSADIQVGFGP